MSASCEMQIKFHGTDEEFQKFINKLIEIEGESPFKFSHNPYYPFAVKDKTITAYNGACRNIWGSYYLDPEVDMYLELAKTTPGAAFEVNSSRIYEGGGGGCETYLVVDYKERKLTFRVQPFVDTMSLAELCSNIAYKNPEEDVQIAIVGKVKLLNTQEELQEYLEDYGMGEISIIPQTEIGPNTDYIICNNPNFTTKAIKKAKSLGIPIITEAQAILKFGDVYDFEDDMDQIIKGITYQDFCKMYTVDATVTEEAFEAEKNAEIERDFILYGDDNVSFNGPWNEDVYVLAENGEFVKQLNKPSKE